MGNWKQYSRYLIVGGIVFVLGLLFHFPLERFGSVITSTIQKESSYIVQSEHLSLTFPIGFNAKNVDILGQNRIQLLHLDELTLRPSIFGLILYPFRKTFTISYKALRGKEVWSGSASFGKEISSFKVRAKNFDWEGSFPLDQNPMFAGRSVTIKTTVNIDAWLTGKTKSLQLMNLSEADGSFEIHSKKTDLDAPMVNQVSFTNVSLESDLKKGLLTIKSVDLQSPKLSAQGKGTLKLAPSAENSEIQVTAQLKADPQDPNISSLIQLFGSMYGIQASPDGSLQLKISGLLNSPERLTISSH